jgi:cytochrome c peroxidase
MKATFAARLVDAARPWLAAACLLTGCGGSVSIEAEGKVGTEGGGSGADTGPTAGLGVGAGAGEGGDKPDGSGDAADPEATRLALLELSPATMPPVPADPTNKYSDDPAAAAFGKQLFFDPGFSGALLDDDNKGDRQALGAMGEAGKVSCAGCHIPADGFLDTRSARQTVSLAAGWGKRKTPSLLDIGHTKIVMWDGRHDALYNQPFGALENAVELNSSRLYAAQQIYRRYRDVYEKLFGAIGVPLDDVSRFPQMTGETTGCRKLVTDINGVSTGGDCHGMPGDKAEFDSIASQDDRDAVTRVWVNAGKAIAAYERLLTCGPGRFDAWVHGDTTALTESEQRGAKLFVGERADGTRIKNSCNTCHSGPFMSDQRFHNVGLEPGGVGPAGSFYSHGDTGAEAGLTAALADPLNVRGAFSDGDDGRLPKTVGAELSGAFRTPMLRCVAMRPTFMHTGQIQSLPAVVSFFNRGGDERGFPGVNELTPLNLTSQESADLVAFLETLNGPGPEEALKLQPELPAP